jgi:hypothetical protein
VSLGALALTFMASAGAGASGVAAGWYSGRTSQGQQITFVVAGGQVSQLETWVIDSCDPGTWDDYLTPHPAPIATNGLWTHRAVEDPTQPTIYHGQISGSSASGTIADTIANSSKKLCSSQVTYRAKRANPLRIASATVGSSGIEVQLAMTMPPASDGNGTEPNTGTALLLYATSGPCLTSYAAADSLARSENPNGSDGLISDAYVDADYGFASSRGESKGTFYFDVSSNDIFAAQGSAPFPTVCAMLYAGQPAATNPSADIALETVKHPLTVGSGPINDQP